MTAIIEGLHHVTAISGPAQRNLDFYAKVLGLRFVKKTVNFDDPSVYHLYYGNRQGTPGTVMTFFPWERMGRGRPGVGEASLTQFAVPPGSLPFWRTRLEANAALVSGPADALRRGRPARRGSGRAQVRARRPGGRGRPGALDDRRDRARGRDPRLPRRDA